MYTYFLDSCKDSLASCDNDVIEINQEFMLCQQYTTDRITLTLAEHRNRAHGTKGSRQKKEKLFFYILLCVRTSS